MTINEAIDLIKPGSITAGTWADFGAGSGTITRALAELAGAESTVIAVDRDASAVTALCALPARNNAARIIAVRGDVESLDTIAELQQHTLDGALFANVLHFVAQPAVVLAQARRLLRPGAHIIVVEYDNRHASRWVPYPLGPDALTAAAKAADFGEPVVVRRRPSRYQGELYCAVISPC